MTRQSVKAILTTGGKKGCMHAIASVNAAHIQPTWYRKLFITNILQSLKNLTYEDFVATLSGRVQATF